MHGLFFFKRQWLIFLLPVLLLHTLADCSDAANQSLLDDKPLTTNNPDTTSPSVVSVYPNNGTTQDRTEITLSVVFNEAMLASSINSSSFTVDNGSTGSIVYEVDSKTATFSPDRLYYSTHYTARLTTEITDEAGNPLPEDYIWTFSVKDIARFAYIANRTSNTISHYSVDFESGRLDSLGYFRGLDNPTSMVVEPQGKLAFVSNAIGNTISIFSINAFNGRLTEVQGSPFGTGLRPFISHSHPTLPYLFVPNSTDSTITSLIFDSELNLATSALGSPYSTNTGFPSIVTSDSQGKFLFVTDFQGSVLSVYSIDQTRGVLNEINGSPFATVVDPGGPTAQSLGVTVSPDDKFVIVSNFALDSLAVFSLDIQSGILNQQPGSPIVIGNPDIITNPYEVVFDHSGKFLYVALYSEAKIAAFSFEQNNNTLTELANSPYTTGPNPATVRLDPSGEYLYVGHLGSGTSVETFKIDASTGELIQIHTTQAHVSPFTIAFARGKIPFSNKPLAQFTLTNDAIQLSQIDSTTGTFLQEIQYATISGPRLFFVEPWQDYAYVVGDNSIDDFKLNKSSATLSAIGGSAVTTLDFATSMTSEPSARFVYVSHNIGKLSAYEINRATGVLNQLPNSPFDVAAGTIQLHAGLDGTNLYAMNLEAEQITQFSINTLTGDLQLLTASNIHTGTQNRPQQMVLHANGFLYISLASANSIKGFNIGSNGSLSPMSNLFSAGSEPTGLAIHPSKRFLFAANYSTGLAGNVSIFEIDGITGNLSSTGHSPVAVGAGPTRIESEASGEYLYVLNSTDNTVSVFLIDQQSGQLSERMNSPFPITATISDWQLISTIQE